MCVYARGFLEEPEMRDTSDAVDVYFKSFERALEFSVCFSTGLFAPCVSFCLPVYNDFAAMFVSITLDSLRGFFYRPDCVHDISRDVESRDWLRQ